MVIHTGNLSTRKAQEGKELELNDQPSQSSLIGELQDNETSIPRRWTEFLMMTSNVVPNVLAHLYSSPHELEDTHVREKHANTFVSFKLIYK